jgi:hypothetical protein
LDVHGIQRALDKKIDTEVVKVEIQNHEYKISTLDRNIIRMATDFETFQIAINKLHYGIVELQEANRDVLIGKRSINCLSCSKQGDST